MFLCLNFVSLTIWSLGWGFTSTNMVTGFYWSGLLCIEPRFWRPGGRDFVSQAGHAKGLRAKNSDRQRQKVQNQAEARVSQVLNQSIKTR